MLHYRPRQMEGTIQYETAFSRAGNDRPHAGCCNAGSGCPVSRRKGQIHQMPAQSARQDGAMQGCEGQICEMWNGGGQAGLTLATTIIATIMQVMSVGTVVAVIVFEASMLVQRWRE